MEPSEKENNIPQPAPEEIKVEALEKSPKANDAQTAQTTNNVSETTVESSSQGPITTEKPKKSLKDTAQQIMHEMNTQNFNQAYEGAIVDRKKESFLNYQDKEEKRREMVEIHKALINTLLTNIDSKLVWIESGVEKIVKFFKDRAAQEEEYVKIMTQSLPKLGGFFKDPAHPELFINLTKSLDECDEFHLKQSQNSEVLAKFLRKNVLEVTIIASEKDFKKQQDSLKGPLEDIKKKFASINQERGKRQKGYVFAYNEAQRGNKLLTKDKDMFKKELENVALNTEELKTMKQYGTQTLFLLNETVKLLIKRFSEIQKAFTLYFQKYGDLYVSKVANPEVVVQLLERFNSTDEIKAAFSCKNMLKPDEIAYIKNKTGKSEITYQEVFDVLANIPIPTDLLQSPLVVKEWKAIREGGILKGDKPCHVVVTLDANVLVIERSVDGEFLDTDNILRLPNLKIIPREDRKDYSIVDLLEVVPGLLMDSKKKLTLKFATVDNAEEFRHYVYNYYHTHAIAQK